MQNEKKVGVKVILWGTLIVSLIPPTFVYVQQLILGPQPGNPCSTLNGYLLTSIFSIIVTFSLFLTNLVIIKKITALYEHKLSAFYRIALCLIAGLIASNIIIYFEWQLYAKLAFPNDVEFSKANIFQNQIFATVLVIIVMLILEIRHYVNKLKHAIAEREVLEREFLRAQLEGLKTQISPHFLFNSFNALQSLIEDDPQKAKEFIQELAKVYRYVLEKRDQLVVTLSDEVHFMQSFIYLNKIRFGDNLIVQINISNGSLQHFLPPLTLQLLIENAIKHNIISSQKPLEITIQAEAAILTVSNVFQPRTEKMYSTGIGHANLTDRYKLICDNVPVFGIKDNLYIATIPLISQNIVDGL